MIGVYLPPDQQLPVTDNPHTRRHPLIRAQLPGFWYAELVGKVRGYPRTHESWLGKGEQARRMQAQRKTTKPGQKCKLDIHSLQTPPGYRRFSDKCRRLRSDAVLEASQIITFLKDKGFMAKPTTTDEHRAEEAMEYAVSVIRSGIESTGNRLSATKIIADFCKLKPTTTTEVTISKAEDFLASCLLGDLGAS